MVAVRHRAGAILIALALGACSSGAVDMRDEIDRVKKDVDQIERQLDERNDQLEDY